MRWYVSLCRGATRSPLRWMAWCMAGGCSLLCHHTEYAKSACAFASRKQSLCRVPSANETYYIVCPKVVGKYLPLNMIKSHYSLMKQTLLLSHPIDSICLLTEYGGVFCFSKLCACVPLGWRQTFHVVSRGGAWSTFARHILMWLIFIVFSSSWWRFVFVQYTHGHRRGDQHGAESTLKPTATWNVRHVSIKCKARWPQCWSLLATMPMARAWQIPFERKGSTTQGSDVRLGVIRRLCLTRGAGRVLLCRAWDFALV